MSDPITHTIQRVKRYWFDDGLVETGLGLVFLIVAGLIFLQSSFPEQPAVLRTSAVLVLIFLVAVGLMFRKLLGHLKQRLTYPRTGYIEMENAGDTSVGRWIIVGLSALAAVLILLVDAWPGARIMFAATLLACAGCYLAYSRGVKRFYLLALLWLTAGLVTGMSRLDDIQSGSLLMVFISGSLLVSGIITLTKYLSANPAPKEQQYD